jgi:hypothetical protein
VARSVLVRGSSQIGGHWLPLTQGKQASCFPRCGSQRSGGPRRAFENCGSRRGAPRFRRNAVLPAGSSSTGGSGRHARPRWWRRAGASSCCRSRPAFVCARVLARTGPCSSRALMAPGKPRSRPSGRQRAPGRVASARMSRPGPTLLGLRDECGALERLVADVRGPEPGAGAARRGREPVVSLDRFRIRSYARRPVGLLYSRSSPRPSAWSCCARVLTPSQATWSRSARSGPDDLLERRRHRRHPVRRRPGRHRTGHSPVRDPRQLGLRRAVRTTTARRPMENDRRRGCHPARASISRGRLCSSTARGS